MNPYRRLCIMLSLMVLAGAGLLSLRPAPARAAGPWYVAPGGNDSNSCSSVGTPCATINGAIGKASSGDIVYVAIGTYTSSTGSEVVLIDKSVTLSGGWEAGFTTQGGMSTVDGERARRGMTVNSGVTVTVDRFSIRNGATDQVGGGLYILQSTVTINSSSINNNTGGGINISGGTVTLNNSGINVTTQPVLPTGCWRGSVSSVW